MKRLRGLSALALCVGLGSGCAASVPAPPAMPYPDATPQHNVQIPLLEGWTRESPARLVNARLRASARILEGTSHETAASEARQYCSMQEREGWECGALLVTKDGAYAFISTSHPDNFAGQVLVRHIGGVAVLLFGIWPLEHDKAATQQLKSMLFRTVLDHNAPE